MTRITEFANPRMAQAFVDYMATRGVRLRIEHDDRYTLWLDDDSQLNLVENELGQFIREPNHPRYLAASWQSGTTTSGISYSGSSLMAIVRDRAGPLTLTLMLASIFTFILMQIVGTYTVLSWLSWPNADQHFQLWRWFSHVLPNFSLVPLLFNVIWLWYLGGAVEKRLGSGKLFVIVLISALLSGWMQAKFSGVMFGGFSGVVYALMGYVWLTGERRPDSGLYLERGLIFFLLVMLALGFTGWAGSAVANASHVTGLLLGLAMAFVDTRKTR